MHDKKAEKLAEQMDAKKDELREPTEEELEYVEPKKGDVLAEMKLIYHDKGSTQTTASGSSQHIATLVAAFLNGVQEQSSVVEAKRLHQLMWDTKELISKKK